MKILKPIMFVGTGSDVGKSVINAGFCRIFRQDGYAPAPFKAQNMSLNSYPTPDNLEIGRAQAVQAEAAGVECSVLMNPLLLKPISNSSSQVILHGRPIGNRSAVEYFRQDNRDELFVEVKGAFDTLSQLYNPIVMEGAGSISEMNLWRNDITNMRMAQYADAVTILVADIDRGGVFASVYGSVMLLPEEQRRLIKGIVVNKFRGDISLFDEGRDMIEQITGIPVVGVLPYFTDIFIEQEDSVSLDHTPTPKSGDEGEGEIKIAVVRLPSISNFTDFNTLSMCKGVSLKYVDHAQEINQADIVILPGSKSTISDIIELRRMALDGAILKHHKAGKPLYGVCGGYQMMGEMIYDPDLIEGCVKEVAGLGIIPTSTTIKPGKVTRQCRFQMVSTGVSGEGYEIHSGETRSDSPLLRMESGEADGYYKDDRCWGSYIHGIFDNEGVINSILREVGASTTKVEDYRAMKERNYDLLAEAIRQRVDMEYIYKVMGDDSGTR